MAAAWLSHPRTARAISAGLLAGFIVLGLLSIGVYYLPSAVAMAVGAVRTGTGVVAPAR